MNDTNIKLDDVAKAFAALPQKGRNVICKGKVKASGDLNTHVQGLAPYRTFHLITYSDFSEKTGRLLIVGSPARTSGCCAPTTTAARISVRPRIRSQASSR